MRRTLALLAAMALSSPAFAQGNMLKRESRGTAAETVERLVKDIEAKGLKVAARVDHAAGAKAAGLEMPPTVVVMFGNPKLGTPLMLENPELGIDLPMKILVWQDNGGKVWVGYSPPAGLQARHGIKGADNEKILQTMSQALEGFAKAAAGAN